MPIVLTNSSVHLREQDAGNQAAVSGSKVQPREMASSREPPQSSLNGGWCTDVDILLRIAKSSATKTTTAANVAIAISNDVVFPRAAFKVGIFFEAGWNSGSLGERLYRVVRGNPTILLASGNVHDIESKFHYKIM